MGDLYACPVRLFFTPAVTEWLDVFHQTHEQRITSAGPFWQRTSDVRQLPAMALQAVTFIRDTWNSLLLEQRRPTVAMGRRG